MPNYGQYTDESWKGRFNQKQVDFIKRNFTKSDGYCSVTVNKSNLTSVTNTPVHIFNPNIKADGVKQLASHPDYSLVQGDVINYIDGNKYLCADMDVHESIQSYGKCYKMNTLLKWKDSTGAIQSQFGVDNESLGNQDVTRVIPQTDGKRNIWVQNNALTNTLYKNQRFIFGGKEAYKVTFIDNWSKQGLILLKIEVTQIVPQDDLTNNIAYNSVDSSTNTAINGVAFSVDSLTIKKTEVATVSVYEYVTSVPQATAFTFRIDGISASAYTITATTSNSISIKCNDYYFTGTLVAIKPNLTETAIPLTLASLI